MMKKIVMTMLTTTVLLCSTAVVASELDVKDIIEVNDEILEVGDDNTSDKDTPEYVPEPTPEYDQSNPDNIPSDKYEPDEDTQSDTENNNDDTNDNNDDTLPTPRIETICNTNICGEVNHDSLEVIVEIDGVVFKKYLGKETGWYSEVLGQYEEDLYQLTK